MHFPPVRARDNPRRRGVPAKTDQLHDQAAGGRFSERAGVRDMRKMIAWIDARFPLTALWESQWGKYVAPKNFNFWYYFGSLAVLGSSASCR